MKPIDLTKLVKKHSHGWIALSQDYSKVVGAGKTIELALRQARSHGVKKPILMRAAKSYAPIAP